MLTYITTAVAGAAGVENANYRADPVPIRAKRHLADLRDPGLHALDPTTLELRVKLCAVCILRQILRTMGKADVFDAIDDGSPSPGPRSWLSG